MARNYFSFGMLVMVLTIAMTVVGCDINNNGGGGGNGTFTLTDIPSDYNGKYAYMEAYDSSDNYFFGAESINISAGTCTAARILNGSVTIPSMWTIETGSASKYSGSGTLEVGVIIVNTANIDGNVDVLAAILFPSVTFSNGNATESKSWEDGWLTDWDDEDW